MKKFKLPLIILIVFSMLSVLLSACQTNSANESSADTSSVADTSSAISEESEEKWVLFSNLPDVTYGDADITFLVEGDYQTIYKSVEIIPHEESPELIKEAVTERNNLVEERFKVKIKEVRTSASSTMDAMIRANAVGGTNLYDIVCPYIPTAATLALSNYFYDMNKLEGLHLNEAYWDQTAVNDMSIAGKVFFCTGDFSLLTLGCTHALVFNKTLLENHTDLPDPYQLVKDGEWTIDELYEMGKAVTSDSDGTTGMTSSDTYGFILNNNFPTSMYLGSGERLTTKDSNDRPAISIGTTRAATVVSKVFEVITDKACSAAIESFSTDLSKRGKADIWQLATAMVAEGNCLFRALAVIDIPDLSEYQCSFGILPIPKYDETQDHYSSNVSVVLASCAAIPSSCGEYDRAAVILDAICQASTETTKYSYYEVLLKNRKIQDTESEEMLEYIFNDRVYDLGIIYSWGDIGTFINTIVWSGSNTYASTLQATVDKIQAAMDKTIEFMK